MYKKKNNIRLLFLNPFLYPLLNENKVPKNNYSEWLKYFGGAQVTLTSIIKGLEENDKYRIYIWIWSEFIKDIATKAKEERLIYVGGVYFKWRRFGILYNIILKIYLFILLVTVRPDVVIKSDYGRFLEVIIVLYCYLFNKRYIYVSLTSHELSATGNNFTDSLIHKIMGSKKIFFICQNNIQKEQIKNIIGSDKTTIIKNIYKIDDCIINDITNTNGGKPTYSKHVLWIGRNENVKNPKSFVNICSKIPHEIEKVMICTFNAGNFISYEEIKNIVKTIPNFTLIKKDVHANTQYFFKNALSLVNTSFHEGLPNTFVQASYEGIPIVTLYYDADGIISNSGCGLCTNGNEDMLAEFIKDLYQKNEVFNKSQQGSKSLYHRQFDYEKNIQKFIDVLEFVQSNNMDNISTSNIEEQLYNEK